MYELPRRGGGGAATSPVTAGGPGSRGPLANQVDKVSTRLGQEAAGDRAGGGCGGGATHVLDQVVLADALVGGVLAAAEDPHLRGARRRGSGEGGRGVFAALPGVSRMPPLLAAHHCQRAAVCHSWLLQLRLHSSLPAKKEGPTPCNCPAMRPALVDLSRLPHQPYCFHHLPCQSRAPHSFGDTFASVCRRSHQQSQPSQLPRLHTSIPLLARPSLSSLPQTAQR
jgi:hypothetical protein